MFQLKSNLTPSRAKIHEYFTVFFFHTLSKKTIPIFVSYMKINHSRNKHLKLDVYLNYSFLRELFTKKNIIVLSKI